MQFWFGVAAGLLVGWIGEWILGRRKHRQEPVSDRSLYQELEEARRQLAEMKVERQTSDKNGNTATRTTAQPFAGQDETPVSDSRAQTDQEETVPADDLTAIKGIGPIFAERLNAAGIYTYADLAQSAPETLRTAVDTHQQISPEAWIAEAATLA